MRTITVCVLFALVSVTSLLGQPAIGVFPIGSNGVHFHHLARMKNGNVRAVLIENVPGVAKWSGVVKTTPSLMPQPQASTPKFAPSAKPPQSELPPIQYRTGTTRLIFGLGLRIPIPCPCSTLPPVSTS